MKQKIIEELNNLGIQYEESVDLRRRTWIHRGGIAHLFITPLNSEELESIVRFLYRENIDFFIFGHTSNLYIKNERNIEVVVSTIKCNAFEIKEGFIICESGTSVIKLSHRMIAEGITGFEYLTELPGTVGAAVVNNSSCKTNSISQLLISARVLFPDGIVKTLYPEDFHFSFRNSVFKSGTIEGTILTVTLIRNNGDTDSLKQIALANKLERERILGGHAQNLGCTVNKGEGGKRMRMKYFLPMLAIIQWGKITNKDSLCINRRIYHLLCTLAHYKQVEPYISPYNPIVFMWKDEGADNVFQSYLDFMSKVYNYNSLEIQVIE